MQYKACCDLIDRLVDSGYLKYIGNDVVLDEKGMRFCMFFKDYRDLFSQIFYTKSWLHLFEA